MPGAGKTGLMGAAHPATPQGGKQTINKTLRNPQSFSYEVSHLRGHGTTTQGVTDAARRLRNSGADEVVTTLEDAVVQLAKHAPTLGEQMMPAPMPADVEESASASNLQHGVDISQAKDHPSEAPVGTSVNDRYETGEKGAPRSAHAYLPKTSNRDPEHH